MSSYDKRGSSRRHHGFLSHWVPLAVTVTVVTVGVAAWIWSQRSNNSEDDEEGEAIQYLDYDSADHVENPTQGSSGSDGGPRSPASFKSDLRTGEVVFGTTPAAETTGALTWDSRISGAFRRTPSPQYILDRAGKTVAAGMAAAGTAVGSALAAIRENDKPAFADHDTWSEVIDAKKGIKSSVRVDNGRRRKNVAIVVSADTHLDELYEDGYHEHASILSHIPKQTDHSKIKLFVLIYAPGLKGSMTEIAATKPPPASLSSSFSMVGNEQALIPENEAKISTVSASETAVFNRMYLQAVDLVEREVNILPFTTPVGYVHILHHLKPEVVYLQESLSGKNGSNVQKLQNWLRYDIILVVGAESGHGGLADSESEAERPRQEKKWWQREDRVGRGRGVVVVDSMRVSDDWVRRIQGKG